jgi:hypothetical protein
MFGRFFGVAGLPVGILLLLIALAFGTTGAVFAVIIAAVIGMVLLAGYVMLRGDQSVTKPGEPGGRGRPSGAPVAGEGSGSPLSAAGKRPE